MNKEQLLAELQLKRGKFKKNYLLISNMNTLDARFCDLIIKELSKAMTELEKLRLQYSDISKYHT